jgi:drug/metabolite transporter (DMT)-like permease
MAITFLTSSAAIVQGVAGLVVNGGLFVGNANTRLALCGLILLPTVGGHTLAIYLLRHVKSQMVTLSIPAQFVLATVAAFFLFHEIPSPWFGAGAVLVLAGGVLGVLKSEAGAERESKMTANRIKECTRNPAKSVFGKSG